MRDQLIKLRERMKAHQIDVYLIPTTDYHGSEYVNAYFKCRSYVSGFTGSNGTLVVTMEEARLWTDGRYFLQAAAQLKGSGIVLMKMEEPGVPTLMEYLENVLTETSCLGFDGKVVDCAMGRQLEQKFTLCYDIDLVGEIWADRPILCPTKIYALPECVTGESSESKLARVRKAMQEKGANYHLITKLEEIAWLYNLRGNDVKYTPVFFAFVLIEQETARLYVLDTGFKDIDTLPYFQVFEDLRKLKAGTMLLNENVVSYAMAKSLPSNVSILNEPDPAEWMKAVKNDREIACTKKAHIRDGVAMVKFLYWVKQNIGKLPITEQSAADYLEQCRKEQGCRQLSFETIAGYEGNGAIVHYAVSEETNKTLEAKGLFLVDSGGQYEDGTTDITRTIVLGPITEEMRRDYTTVLKANLRLLNARFWPGTTGAQLDAFTRVPLQELGMDYNHGTGHGVGHILSVHEGPNTISPKGVNSLIAEGMITSDEPGVYIEGKYGIRLENEILCISTDTDELGFEAITFCPFDPEAIDPTLMDQEELEILNTYHKQVYDKLNPHLDPEIAEWLKRQTAPLP